VYERFFKRLIDFSAALVGLFILSPVIIVLTIFLFVYYKGSPFFLQKRPGKNEIPFRMIKFKTMTDAKDENGQLLPFEQRTTKTGNFIRKCSLDEIPQLLNVLVGQMSLVGPRPLLMDYLPRYKDWQKARHNVRPGVTGWAQVNGRNAISWNQKFKYDVWYVNHLSLGLDLKILAMTLKKVLGSEDVNSQANLNMPEFMGGDDE
jgi:undecaprenyl phosphate N,N'-diacetylbacillosamine 1-phosphate transferase